MFSFFTGKKKGNAHRDQMCQRRQAQMAADSFPYLMFVAVTDPKTHPSHATLNGMIWPKDDPVWNVIYPPIGPNCRCRTRSLTDGQIKREKLTISATPEVLKRNIDGDDPSKVQKGLRIKTPEGTSIILWLEYD